MPAERAVTAPRTYFLEEAAELARASMLARLDPALDCQPYFRLDLQSDPPEARHASWDYCDIAGRFVDALLLARQMTGSTTGMEEEVRLRAFLLARANPDDGLFYNAEAPWSRYEADMFCQGRVLLGLVTWLLATGDAAVADRLDALVAGLWRIAVHRDDRCFYPRDIWAGGQWREGGLWNGAAPGYAVQQVVGLVRYYRASGSRLALDLAGRLARYFVYHAGVVRPDGSFVGHTHSQGILPATLGVLAYALAASDEALAQWARRVYEYTRRHTTRFGWVPDGLGRDPRDTPYARTCETCALADLIDLAITLSEAGLGDYWDDVECFARNQLLENQVRVADRALPPERRARSRTPVAAILRGSFDSAALPNRLLGDPHGLLEGCCTPAGARACFRVWSSIASRGARGIVVNLAMSRDAPWGRVVSYEPYRGELRLEVEEAAPCFLRVPEWAEVAGLRLLVDDVARPLRWEGRYLALGTLQPGQVAVLTYPQRRAETSERVLDQEYTVRWKGGTVVRIAPEGDGYPTYQREGFEAPDPPLVARVPRRQPVRVEW